MIQNFPWIFNLIIFDGKKRINKRKEKDAIGYENFLC